MFSYLAAPPVCIVVDFLLDSTRFNHVSCWMVYLNKSLALLLKAIHAKSMYHFHPSAQYVLIWWCMIKLWMNWRENCCGRLSLNGSSKSPILLYRFLMNATRESSSVLLEFDLRVLRQELTLVRAHAVGVPVPPLEYKPKVDVSTKYPSWHTPKILLSMISSS